MNEKKEDEKPSGFGLLAIVIGVMVMIVPFTVLTYTDYMQDKAEIKELNEVIKEKQNVSDDYVKGWNDCIEHLEEIRTRATNATQQVMDLTQ